MYSPWHVVFPTASAMSMMRLLIISAVAVTMSGCSLSGRFYLRNLSDNPAKVTIMLDEFTTTEELGDFTLPYDDHVRRIRFSTSEKFQKRLEVRKLGLCRVEFILPPHSTVFLGDGFNRGKWKGFQQARIQIGDIEKSVIIQEPDQMNMTMQGLTKFTGYYDITL
jgi:hypothetical protein